MTEPAFDDLARLWRSAPAVPAEDMAGRAMMLRRQEIRKAVGGTILTLGLLAALALEFARTEEPEQLLLISALAGAAAAAQLRLVLLRRKLWRGVGQSPLAYWRSVAAKARLGIRIARLALLGGPTGIAAGALLALVFDGGEGPDIKGYLLLVLAAIAAVALGLRGAWREGAELERAEEVLRELSRDDA